MFPLRKLLIATTNKHKAQEIGAVLSQLWPDLTLLTLRDVPPQDEVVEDGLTFLDNARIKAKTYGTRLNVACLADDSGLSVDALQGAPGVYSARYAGPKANDVDNNARLVSELSKIGPGPFSAHYTCALVLCTPTQAPIEVQAQWPGHIHLIARGTRGFGYDPYFVPLGETRHVAELSEAEKNAQSHRALALRQLVTRLKQVDK